MSPLNLFGHTDGWTDTSPVIRLFLEGKLDLFPPVDKDPRCLLGKSKVARLERSRPPGFGMLWTGGSYRLSAIRRHKRTRLQELAQIGRPADPDEYQLSTPGSGWLSQYS